MKQSVYLDQIERLKNQFGEKAYADERVQAIWDAVKNYDESIFILTITEVIANHSHAPLKNKIQEAYNEIKSKTPNAVKKVDCVYCGGVGFICDDSPLPYVKRCICEAGEEKPKYISKFKGFPEARFPSQATIAQIHEDARLRAEKLIKETMNKKAMEIYKQY